MKRLTLIALLVAAVFTGGGCATRPGYLPNGEPMIGPHGTIDASLFPRK